MTFIWLVSEDIISEYKEVLTRPGVRRNLVGEVINLLREEAEIIDVRTRRESDRLTNYPPNRHPRAYFLVPKMKFLAKIFAL